MPTSNLTPQNDYVAALLNPVELMDTTIFIDGAVPSGDEGFLDIGEGLSNHERIYYTSKGSNFVTCPSVAAGRGIGGTAAAVHAAGEVVKMKWNAEWWKALQDGSALIPVSKVIVQASAPPDGSATGTYKVTPLSLTATLVARPVKITATVDFGQRSSTSDTNALVTVKEGSTTVATGIGRVNGTSANTNDAKPIAFAYFTPSAGAHTYDVYVSLAAGGDMSINSGFSVLEYT